MLDKAVRIEDDWGECPEGDMDYIADMLGTGFRDKMVAEMGGMTIKVPKHDKVLTDDHLLVQRLGHPEPQAQATFSGIVEINEDEDD